MTSNIYFCFFKIDLFCFTFRCETIHWKFSLRINFKKNILFDRSPFLFCLFVAIVLYFVVYLISTLNQFDNQTEILVKQKNSALRCFFCSNFPKKKIHQIERKIFKFQLFIQAKLRKKLFHVDH